MAISIDEVVTQFRVLGERETVDAYRAAGSAAGALETQLAGLRRTQVAAAAGLSLSIGVLAGLGKAALAAADDQVSFARASQNFKGAFPVEELQAFSTELQTLTGIDDDRIAGIAGVLGTFQIPKADAQALVLPILNAAESLKALGLTAESVSAQVGKAIQTGQAAGLRRAGIIIDPEQFKSATTEAARAQLVIAALQAQGGDAALTFRDSLPGAIAAFGTELRSLEEGVGEGAAGLLRPLVEGAVAVVHAMNQVPGPVKAAGGVIVGVLAAAVAVYSAGTLIALNNTIRLAEAQLVQAAAAKVQVAANTQAAGSIAALGTASAGAAAASGGGAAAGGVAAGAGALARLRGFGVSAAGRGVGAGGLTALAGLGLGMLPDTGNQGFDVFKAAGAGALTYGGTGAAIGSLIAPGVGTAVGAIVGGVGGALAGGLGKQDELRQQGTGEAGGEVKALQERVRQLEESNRLLQQIADNTKNIRVGTLAFSDVPGRDQAGAGSLFD